MESWRSKAFEILPEIHNEILEAETPMMLWIEISFYFDKAYIEPRNENLIQRIYNFEEWCLTQKEGGETAAEHLPTCVAVAFWEHIPANKMAREDMLRWFSLKEVMANQHFFRYHLSDGNFEELIEMYALSSLKPARQLINPVESRS